MTLSNKREKKEALMTRMTLFITFFLCMSTIHLASCNPSDNVDPLLGLLALGNSNPTDPGPQAGDKTTYTVNSVDFKMIYVPGKTFPTGTDDSGSSIVSDAYQIGSTEVTYELWSSVYTWATDTTVDHDGDGLTNSADGDDDAYTFANAGTMGDGSGDTNQYPVTTINWRDVIVWNNALTEYYNAENGASLKPVYYRDSSYNNPQRDSSDGTCGASSVGSTDGDCDKPYIYAATSGNTDMANNTADGFRLPTTDEWELASRWLGDTAPDTGDLATEYVALNHNDDGSSSLTAGYYWTPGDYASGATADYNDATATGNVSVYNGNSGSSTAAVKSKSANALGLYDMSGNVHEWNFDWHPDSVGTGRVLRGGSCVEAAVGMQLGDMATPYPFIEGNIIGFRPLRTP